MFAHVHKLKLPYIFIYGNSFAFIENVFDNKCLIINKYIYIYIYMYACIYTIRSNIININNGTI